MWEEAASFWMDTFLQKKTHTGGKKILTRKTVSPNAHELDWCTVLAAEERVMNTLHEIRTGIYIQELFPLSWEEQQCFRDMTCLGSRWTEWCEFIKSLCIFVTCFEAAEVVHVKYFTWLSSPFWRFFFLSNQN